MDSRLLRLGLAALFWATLITPGAAQIPTLANWNSNASSCSWARGGATLDLDFYHNRYCLNGTGYSFINDFLNGSSATFTRSDSTANATWFNSSGTLNTAASGAVRTTYAYNGSAWVNAGTMLEATATNSIRNNTMVGAAASSSTQLVTNGTFSSCSGSTCSGWTTTVNGGAGSISFTSGTATLTGDGTHAASIYQAITTTAGSYFTITVTNGSGNAVTVQAGTTAGGANLLAATTLNASATTSYQTVVNGSTTLYVQVSNASTTAANVTTVSVTSDGIMPTDWALAANNNNGLIWSVVGSGTTNGISYIDLNLSGTATSTGTSYYADEGSNTISASQGQAWTLSRYLLISGGSTTGITNIIFTTQEINSSVVGLQDDNSSSILSSIPTSGSLAAYRASYTDTLSNASTAYIRPYIQIVPTNGATINMTLRIGMPQLEKCPSAVACAASSVIPTSGSAGTRAGESFSNFTRNSVGTYFNSSGTLQAAGAYVPRLDYGSSGGNYPTGVLIEQASTNSIRNNTMSGAAASSSTQLVTNGTFTSCSGSTCTGWTTTVNGGTGSVSFTSGKATLTGDGTNAASIYQAITTVSGYTYTIAVTNGSGNAVTVQAGTAAGGATLLAASTVNASATTSYQFTASGTTSYVQVNNASTTAANVTTVSVKSAGEAPTDWGTAWLGTAYGVSVQIADTGTANGISYMDVTVSGTPTVTGTVNIAFESATQIAAAQGQTWTESVFLAVTAGSVASFGVTTDIYEIGSSGTVLAQSSNADITLSSTLSRYSLTYTTSNASTTYVRPMLILYYSNGVALSYTLRIGMPQMEELGFPTSVIPTSGSAVTRAADAFTVPTTAAGANGAWYTQGVGTLGAVGVIPYASSTYYYPAFVSVDDGTSNNVIGLEWPGEVGNGLECYVYNGGTYQSGGGASTYTVGSLGNIVVAFQNNNTRTAALGVNSTLNTSITIPASLTELRVGQGLGYSLDGWINRIWYMPTRQPDASLKGYTTQ